MTRKTSFFPGLRAAFAPLLLAPSSALASVYNGPGLSGGVGAAGSISGVSGSGIRSIVGRIVNAALTYVALIAVIVLIIAGIYLILSLGNDQAKETAKKVLLYTALGLLLILFSKAIVYFLIALPG
ncbi:MAG: hypothetical protein PHI23_05180 [Candidatus Peribacteraceae bacterium]|nr:hypothetical protein [Candidatus Peribacteraceae bacterium]